jgi:integrase
MARQKDRGLRRGQGYTERRLGKDGAVYYVARWLEGKTYRSKVFRDPDPASALEAAEQYIRERDRALRLGKYIALTEMLVIDLVNQYLARGESRWAPNTYATYCQRTRACIEPRLGSVRLQSLTTSQIQHWIDQLVRDGWSAEVVVSASLLIGSALKEAVQLGILSTNPAIGVRRPKIGRKHHVTWTADEARLALAEVANEPRWNAVYRLALATGMRPGELRGLKWKDIDLTTPNRATVTIRRTMTKDRNGRPTLGQDTKTAGAREVAIPASVAQALQKWRTAQKEIRIRSTQWQDLDAVFTGVGGVHLSLSAWQNRHRKLCDAIQARMPEGESFPRPTLHELRHTAATLMLANNIHVKIVSDILGHRKIETTLNIYQHVSADLQRSASERLDASLNATTSSLDRAENG